MPRLALGLAASLAVLATSSTPALAWGQTGHRVTGAIAERHLGKRARAAVKAILGVESLAEASTWPDFMRASPDPFWRKAGAYHSVAAPDGHYVSENAPPEGDAVTALALFTQTVRDPKAPLADRQRALRFIVHIIGDLHQPLHACNGIDHCGGDVQIAFLGQPTNLHMLWDEGLIDRQQLSFTEWTNWLDARITRRQIRLWQDTDPLIWIAESAALRRSVYPVTEVVGKSYAFQFQPVIEDRLSMAGIRIAVYLDKIFSTTRGHKPS
jgi:hypothetical protein